MRVGVFTPLLSQLPLDGVINKLKGYNIDTVELGTGNYPGDAHCKLSMLDNKNELNDFKSKLADNGFTISALSSHSAPRRTVRQWNLPWTERICARGRRLPAGLVIML